MQNKKTNALSSGSAARDKGVTIITVALTGASGSKQLNPHTPITPEEIAQDAIACYKAGASIVHIHMKHEDGIMPSMEVEKFKKTRDLINQECDVIVNMTTSGEIEKVKDTDIIGYSSLEGKDTTRMGVLDLAPELATFDVPTTNFGNAVFLNPLPFLEELGMQMQAKHIKPEVEIFDFGDIEQAKRLIRKGILQEPVHFQFCLGVAGGAPATPENLTIMSRLIPENSTWSCFGIGSGHLPVLLTGLALGGHVRVGLEDNLYFSRGEYATNVKLVERAVKLAELAGNQIATPNEAREILGLSLER